MPGHTARLCTTAAAACNKVLHDDTMLGISTVLWREETGRWAQSSYTFLGVCRRSSPVQRCMCGPAYVGPILAISIFCTTAVSMYHYTVASLVSRSDKHALSMLGSILLRLCCSPLLDPVISICKVLTKQHMQYGRDLTPLFRTDCRLRVVTVLNSHTAAACGLPALSLLQSSHMSSPASI